MNPIRDTILEVLLSQLTTATVFLPDSVGYGESIVRWSDTGIKRAGIVVQPVDVADIRTALLWAQEHEIDLAVKGGGHSAAGTSSSEGGLVIDLSRMNQVTVDLAQKTITAQGGSTWKEVDEAGAAHGLATVGGTVNHTGIGGLTLGGGYGWLSGQYGLTIDNLRCARVMLADGSLVTASTDEHPDLFWGLRGAGYNFGVVVDFTYQAYDQQNLIYAGFLGFPPAKLEAVIGQLNVTLAKPDAKSGAMCTFAHAPDGSGPVLVVVCFYNGSREEGQRRFSGFLDLEPVLNTLDMVPYPVINLIQNPMTSYGDRKSFKGIFYAPPLDPQFARTIFNDFMGKIESDPDLIRSAIILEFFDMRKICETPLPSTALASRNSTQNGIIFLRWTDASKDLEHRAWAREMQAKWKLELDVKADTKDDVPQYINYAEPGDSAVANIYGSHLERLREVKARYDPKNVFHKMQPIQAKK
ncbi:FAD linked oxidase N-terminal [Penicillium capsulatum]|uniref:FAD linked oxidase N-terminal n=1 Tax=Penicillium capsulatum TaxID=69766 RepID=A0A9W9IHK1_9EURO|nr:FAD linked oxidase N-terminal [Penicillium capsulatum]KAJ6123100.1 FAD linked oxidase N-terminal [Penicillium capsulatum]